MKKLVVSALTLLTCGSAYALPVGNPSEASLFFHGAWWESYCNNPCDPCFSWVDAWSLRIGFYGDYVFNRHMEVDHHNGKGQDIDHTQLFTNAGYLVLNICDRIEAFGTVGATNIFIRTDTFAFTTPSFVADLVFSPEFSWSVGGRATVWQCNGFVVGVEGQYFQTSPDLDHFIRGDNGDFIHFNDVRSSRYSEWQVGVGLAYRFATRCPTIAMVPYMAVQWSRSKFNLGSFTFTDAGTTFILNPLEAKKLWGYAVGLSLTLCDMIGVTAEGRFGSEKAFYINGQFRF